MSDCYLLFEEVNAEAGISRIVCASTEEKLIKQKQETITDKRTYIETIPFLGTIESNDYDGLEPLGCHGCGDW